MILYCDTSALIKRYVEEEGTEYVDSLWDDASIVVTSVVAYAEIITAFSKKLTEGVLSVKEYNNIVLKFKEDYEQLILVPVSMDLNKLIEELIKRHPIRWGEAIHLASALIFVTSESPKPVFACFDSILNQAAIEEGLTLGIEI